MPLVSKTVEVNADADTILRIVADFEKFPEWNPEAKAVYVLARYDDGRPSQLRLDMEIQGQSGTFIQAVYYPGENQIQTVLQQGEVFTKQDQLFSVVAMGPSSLLTVDLDVEVSLPVPAVMVKKLINDVLEHLANNLKTRAEQLSANS
ncbi:SRPBCC family protein [Mycobacterium crocinum]|uniref:SRPBCC family protein n=1 Tax=Mycolicibacterium crocinum TaxID=388459 RepID=A0ABY3TSD5_9MYCO|nr:SRPBCC family protein [Mycolicibacterium crocinum]MCV7216490.1 SRPBCC family protein [Mycolicibacterium crocinum]ULN41867.1 SRPBCC family protein [Mycolicibacterium crocinum]